MSNNFKNILIKDKSRHTITTIKSNQNILLSQLKNFIHSSASLSRQRSRSKNNYSSKNIYNYISKNEKSAKKKDEIIKKLKERIRALENRIQFLELKVKKLNKINSKFNISSKNEKNYSIGGKENLKERNEKKEFSSITFSKKKCSLKAGYNKKRTSSHIITEEKIYDIKERYNTIINSTITYCNCSNSSKLKKNSKTKKKIELNLNKFKKKKQSLNYQNINEILKKTIIKKNNLRKSKHNDLDLKTSMTKLISKIPKTSRHYQTENNTNLSSKITNSTTFNYYIQNNSNNNYSEYNNVLTINNNFYSEEGYAKDEHMCTINNNTINNSSNEIVRKKLNIIKKRILNLLEKFARTKANDS